MSKDNIRVFRPTTKLIRGTSVPTAISELVWFRGKGRPIVRYTDGNYALSDYTLTEVLARSDEYCETE